MPLTAILENYSFVDDSKEKLNSTNLDKLSKPVCRILGQEDHPVWVIDGSKIKGGVTLDKLIKNTVYGKSVDIGKFAFVDEDENGNKYWRTLKSNSDGTEFVMIKNGLPYFQKLGDRDDPIRIHAETLRPKGSGFILAINQDKKINGHPTLVWIQVYDSGLSYSFFHPGERQDKESGSYIISASSTLEIDVASSEEKLVFPFDSGSGSAIEVESVEWHTMGALIHIKLVNTTGMIFNNSSGIIIKKREE